MQRIELGENARAALKTWGVAALLFILIALVAIFFIFSPPVLQVERNDVVVQSDSGSNLDLRQLGMTARAWMKYPEYTVGLGISAGLGFAGFCYCFVMLQLKAREGEEDTE
jgi:hypothetical protein